MLSVYPRLAVALRTAYQELAYNKCELVNKYLPLIKSKSIAIVIILFGKHDSCSRLINVCDPLVVVVEEEVVGHAHAPAAVVVHLFVVDLVEQWYVQKVVAWHLGVEP